MTELIIQRRFCGPPDSGNGGWTAGALATLAALASDDAPRGHSAGWPQMEVSLRQPPPLDTAMSLSQDGEDFTASLDGAAVATARRVDADLTPVDPVDVATAVAAEAAYPGHTFHPFASCFVCGTARAVGDGLRIFPGAIGTAPAGYRVAATWTPLPDLVQDGPTDDGENPRASVAAAWGSLDCIGGWAGDIGERLMVLGRMTTRIDTLPVVGEQHVVVGEGRGQEGRKTFTAASLYDPAGRLVATAEHVWIAVNPEHFGGSAPA